MRESTQKCMFSESFESRNAKEQAELLVEEELSPEILEQIMDKVQDINKPGTAYSAFSGSEIKGKRNIESVLQSGLLGLRGSRDELRGGDPKEIWAKALRSPKKRTREEESSTLSSVFFNIVGRISSINYPINLKELDKNKLEIEQSYWASREGGMSVIFDLDKFKERDEEFYNAASKVNDFSGEEFLQEHKKLSKKYPPKIREFFSVDLTKTPSSADGFLLHYRVRPQWFRGITLSDTIKDKNKVELDHKEMIQRAKEFAKIMCEVDKDKLELLLPIYDIHGNLLWPKEMSYDEVKKMVQEKEENK